MDKEKNELNEKNIVCNKVKARLNKDRANKELIKQYLDLKREVRTAYENWEKREGADFRVSGYLMQELLKNGYKKLSKEKRFESVIKLWNKKVKESHPKKTHVGLRRFILSPDPKTLEGLSEEQKKEVLERTIDNTMKKFKDNYIARGDRISYLSSVHSDTNAFHAHIYLLPYTKNGQYLSMNADRYLNKRQRAYAKTDRFRDFNDKNESKLEKIKTMAANSFDKERRRYEVYGLDKEMNRFEAKVSKLRSKMVQEEIFQR